MPNTTFKDGDCFRNGIGLFGIMDKNIIYYGKKYLVDTYHTQCKIIYPKRIVLHDISGHNFQTNYGINRDLVMYYGAKRHLGRKSIYIEFPKENVFETIKSYWDEEWYVQTELTESLDALYKRWKLFDEENGNIIV